MTNLEHHNFVIKVLHLFSQTPFYVYNSHFYEANWLQVEVGKRGYYTGKKKAAYIPWYIDGYTIRVFDKRG